MKLTYKQNKVLVYVFKNNQITKKKAIELIDDHHSNGAFHVGNVLSRMVKTGLLKRIKPGLYELGNDKYKHIDGFTNPDQTKLF